MLQSLFSEIFARVALFLVVVPQHLMVPLILKSNILMPEAILNYINAGCLKTLPPPAPRIIVAVTLGKLCVFLVGLPPQENALAGRQQYFACSGRNIEKAKYWIAKKSNARRRNQNIKVTIFRKRGMFVLQSIESQQIEYAKHKMQNIVSNNTEW